MVRVGRLSLDLKIGGRDGIALDSKMADILEAVARCGSITAASKAVNISYRTAWLAIDRANKGLGTSLVKTTVGGNKAGGACLTPFGEGALALYRGLEQHITFHLEVLESDFVIETM